MQGLSCSVCSWLAECGLHDYVLTSVTQISAMVRNANIHHTKLENVEHCGDEPEQADTGCTPPGKLIWVQREGFHVPV